jgi:tryptophanyl-tRNA synthetase
VEELDTACRGATIGCVQCKKELAEGMVQYFAPFRERREALAQKPQYLREVVKDGACRASVIARATLDEVKTVMNLK